MRLNRRLTAVVLLVCLSGLVLTGCGGDDKKAEKPAAGETTAAPGGAEPSDEPTAKSGKKPSAAAKPTRPPADTYTPLDDARCAQVSTIAARALGAPVLEYRPEGGACENPDDAFEGDDVDGRAVHVTVNTLPDRFPTGEAYVAELRAE